MPGPEKSLDDANLRYAEAAIMERRVKERKRRDRWGRRFERLVLLALVLIYLFGFGQTADKDTLDRLAATNTELKATNERLRATNAALKTTNARITREATRATNALCALRHDLEDRVAATDDFLAKHPQGIPGIPVATLRQSQDGQRRTIRALSNLKCLPPK